MQPQDNRPSRYSGAFSRLPDQQPTYASDLSSGDPDRPTWLRLPMHRPVVTIGVLVILVAVFALELIMPDHQVEFDYMKDNFAIVNGEWWRLFTATLLHDKDDYLHIIFNGFGIYLFGQQVETFFGRWRFVVIYVLAGLAGSIASFAFSPQPSLGASGALFGLVGAMGVYFWLYRSLLGAQGRAQLWNVLFIISANLALGLSQPLIDNWGHIGGLLGGLATGLVFLPRYKPGRSVGIDERMLEDKTPIWVSVAGGVGLVAVEAILFWLALMAQSGQS